MKKTTRALVAASALLAASAAASAQTPAPPARPQTPAAAGTRVPLEAIPEAVLRRELKGLDGRSFFLSNFRGQVFVLNLWATWCGPCRLEVPELNKIYDEYAGRGVRVLGLTVEHPAEDAEKVRNFVEQYEIRYELGWADADTSMTLFDGRHNIPQTFVVGPDGRVIRRLIGYSPAHSAKTLRELLDRALAGQSEAPAAARGGK